MIPHAPLSPTHAPNSSHARINWFMNTRASREKGEKGKRKRAAGYKRAQKKTRTPSHTLLLKWFHFSPGARCHKSKLRKGCIAQLLSVCANSPPSARLKNGGCKNRDSVRSTSSALLFVVAISCQGTSMQFKSANTSSVAHIMYYIVFALPFAGNCAERWSAVIWSTCNPLWRHSSKWKWHTTPTGLCVTGWLIIMLRVGCKLCDSQRTGHTAGLIKCTYAQCSCDYSCKLLPWSCTYGSYSVFLKSTYRFVYISTVQVEEIEGCTANVKIQSVGGARKKWDILSNKNHCSWVTAYQQCVDQQ